jgi:DNA polymerase-3 subunit beta
MQYQIAQSHHKNALDAVFNLIPRSSTLPALSTVRIATAGTDVIAYSATDLKTTLTLAVPGTVSLPGVACVPAKQAREIARSAPETNFTISSTDSQTDIKFGRSRFKLPGVSPADWPVPPQTEWSSTLVLPAAALTALTRNTTFATSTDQNRPVLQNVLLELDEDRVTMVATNGHRLGLATVSHSVDAAAAGKYVVPPEALKLLADVAGSAETVEIKFASKRMSLRAGNAEIITQLLDDPYPEYRAVLPKGHNRTAIVDRVELLAAARRVAVVASDKDRRLAVNFERDHIVLEAMTPDLGNATDRIEASLEGEPLRIGFNAAYLIDLLGRIDTPRIQIGLTAPISAVTLTPLPDSTPLSTSVQPTFILMPLRLLEG